jgi:hypothetical protein
MVMVNITQQEEVTNYQGKRKQEDLFQEVIKATPNNQINDTFKEQEKPD